MFHKKSSLRFLTFINYSFYRALIILKTSLKTFVSNALSKVYDLQIENEWLL